MNFSEIANKNEYEILIGSETSLMNFEVLGLSYDSRVEGENKIFCATYGAGSDANEYLNKAVDNNYKVLVSDQSLEDLISKYQLDKKLFEDNNAVLIKVEDVNEMLATFAERLNDFPSKSIKLVGVTGTNGKTTTTMLIHNTLKELGHKCGLIGTMEIHYDDEVETSKNTTPDAVKLQEVYKKMKDKGCEYNVMEVSSHSLSLKRVCHEEFEVGVYTNLTEDHLDFHGSMENYRDAKLILFEKAKKCVLNADTEYSDFYIRKCINMHKEVMLYTIDEDFWNRENTFEDNYGSINCLVASNLDISIMGSEFDVTYKNGNSLQKERVKVRTPGVFSVYNALSTIGSLLELGYDLKEILDVLKTQPGITGRFQTFASKKGFGVAVDYAHTPDGLVNILNTAKSFVKGRIITVFGCGGDRDKLKRPIMGKIVMELSDVTIVTSDNPRTEDPEKIIEDIEVGMKDLGKDYLKISDRYEATKKAIELAEEGDFVIIAGKGHEDYQIIGKEKVHFSDIENVEKLID